MGVAFGAESDINPADGLKGLVEGVGLDVFDSRDC